jgi:hypothetical protein
VNGGKWGSGKWDGESFGTECWRLASHITIGELWWTIVCFLSSTRVLNQFFSLLFYSEFFSSSASCFGSGFAFFFTGPLAVDKLAAGMATVVVAA